jgi:hypothetical protein
MKLELKHLALYLPYDLKCKSTTILFGEEDNGIYEMGLISMRGVLKGTGKPILRPLSDLTNSLNLFVEIFSLCTSINYTKNEIKDIFDLRSPSRNYYLLTELNRQISVSYDHDLRVFRYFDSKGESNQMKSQLELFNVLFKNHFDIFGLIEKGLAIDINTIK